MIALDYFAGPSGWDIAARELGIEPLGIELDRDTCATRDAAALDTHRADIRDLDPREFAADLFIASPPCPTFSRGGKHAGKTDAEYVHEATDLLLEGKDGRWLRRLCKDERSMLVVEPLRYLLAVEPTYVALEQVPAVLPYWGRIAAVLQARGYSVAFGIVNAADYGVPQTRERAVLLASRAGHVALPRHSAQRNLAMCDVLRDWRIDDRIGFPRRSDGRDGGAQYRSRDLRRGDQLAFTLTEKARSWRRWRGDDEPVPVTLEEACRLQTFPAGYPFAGSRTSQFLQLANAVPPRLARALLEEVTR